MADTFFPKELLTTYEHFTDIRYLTVSAMSFYVWECLITMADEVELIWSSQWSYVKILYLVNRYATFLTAGSSLYYNLLDVPTTETCLYSTRGKCVYFDALWVLGFLQAVLGLSFGVFSGLATSLVLQMRVYALYGRNKTILVVMSILFVIMAGSMITISAKKLTNDHAGVIPGTPFCDGKIPGYFFALWIPNMIFDFILVVLVCYRSYRTWHTASGGSWRGARLGQLMLRDSVLYFFLSFSMSLLNTLIWNLAPLDLFQLATAWASVVSPAIAGRLILNIRDAYWKDVQGTSGYTMNTHGETLELRVRPGTTDATDTTASWDP